MPRRWKRTPFLIAQNKARRGNRPGFIEKDICFYMSPVSPSRSRKLHFVDFIRADERT
jgi:hypothetical protein